MTTEHVCEKEKWEGEIRKLVLVWGCSSYNNYTHINRTVANYLMKLHSAPYILILQSV